MGDLELPGRLGEGGQGVVYLARTPAGAHVAVKWLQQDQSDDAVSVGRFPREAEVARSVAPFCTAAVLGTGVENGRPYIVSEFVKGTSLQQIVQEEGPRTGPSLDRLAIGTATALAAIHRAGIVHRDFKPANVIVGAEGIRSNVVRPGFVLTECIRKIFNEEQRQQFADISALGRVCEPQDIAEVVAFLASPASSYVNCTVIDVNRGRRQADVRLVARPPLAIPSGEPARAR
ncbi:SDR family oxidoreductase [Nonomuraea sp. NPDC049784]|uniref:SDR family oxidoreductase n=1 Tax=Nonomuraea sp. NPDC049784 TaxID=3154361 RepID=UPI0033F7CBBF